MKFQEIIKQDKPVLVDFYATWCGPCKTLSPILDELKTRIGTKGVVLKVDVDKNSHAAATYQIRSVPTLILFKKGKIVWRKSGVVPLKELQEIMLKNQ